MKNFEYIKSINISKIKIKVNNYTIDKWNEFDFRQKTFDIHKKTRTIPLIYNTEINTQPTQCEDFKFFDDDMVEIYNVLKSYYLKGFIIRAILVKLLSNTNIPKHIDKGYGLENCFRHHIPIITNKKVLFTVDDETIHMKPGEIWKIDNLNKFHSVVNNSKIDRIHLIVDWKYE